MPFGRDAVDVLEPLVESPDLVPPSGSIEPVTGELDDEEVRKPGRDGARVEAASPKRDGESGYEGDAIHSLRTPAVGRAVTSTSLARPVNPPLTLRRGLKIRIKFPEVLAVEFRREMCLKSPPSAYRTWTSLPGIEASPNPTQHFADERVLILTGPGGKHISLQQRPDQKVESETRSGLGASHSNTKNGAVRSANSLGSPPSLPQTIQCLAGDSRVRREQFALKAETPKVGWLERETRRMSALGHAAPHPGSKEHFGSGSGSFLPVSAPMAARRARACERSRPAVHAQAFPPGFPPVSRKETAALVAAGLVTETRNRLSLTAAGETAVARYFRQKAYEARPWHELRDLILIAKGLGCEKEAPARLKPLLRVEGCARSSSRKAFGLPTRKNQPPTRQRRSWAVVALERAFGNRIKAGFGKGSALSSKAGRLLAGQLSRTPRSFSTDAKLIAALAAEHVGAVETDLDAFAHRHPARSRHTCTRSWRQRRSSGFRSAPSPCRFRNVPASSGACRQRSDTCGDYSRPLRTLPVLISEETRAP